MITLLLIRHAETDGLGKRIAGWMPDAHLNPKGRKQAAELAERLAPLAIRAVYSSPLERALETAEAIARRSGLTVSHCEEIGEVHYGEWTGKMLGELEPLPEWRRFNELRSLARIPGGERMLSVQTRMVAMMESFREKHPGQVVAAVSHGDPIRAAVAHCAGIPLDLAQRIEISPASVTALWLGAEDPRIVRLNDTGGLDSVRDGHV